MRTKILSILAISALLVASCSNDNDNNEPQAVKFSSSIAKPDNAPAVRAANDTWASGDVIGVFMVNNGDGTIAENATNKQHTTTGGSSFTAVTGDEIYYPVDETKKVDFIAYYPYSNTTIDVTEIEFGAIWYSVDIRDQSNQSAIDLMTASADNGRLGYDKTNTSAVGLVFKHQLSKIVINVKNGDGVTSLTGLDVKVMGIPTVVEVNVLEPENGTSATFNNDLITPFNAGDNSYELILPPTEYYKLSNSKVKFSVGGNTYEWTISDNTAGIDKFKSGEKYTFEVTLTENKVSVTGSVTPWVK